MKKITLKTVMASFALAGFFAVNAQQKQPVGSVKALPSKTFEITETTKQAIEKTGFARCLSVENEEILQANNLNRMSSQEFENWLAPHVAKIKADKAAGKAPQAIYNIPVVIHIIHNGDPVNTPGNLYGENISDAQALSQISVMNQDYRRMAGSPGGANTTGVAVDVEINFCLAQTDPNGNLTNGIIRHNITPYSNNVADGAGGVDWETRTDVETMKTTTQWDPAMYLNMWTFRPGGLQLSQGGLAGLLGYAQFPDNAPNLPGLNSVGGNANTDGVTAGFDAFGTMAENDGSFIMNATYTLGRTMTHEVGHWLGLRHIWGDGSPYDPTGVNGTVQGSCPVDDFCNDTPNARAANFSCISNNNCGAGAEQVENYMDYTHDSCMDTFTADQKIRMQAIMAQAPRRASLATSSRCQAPMPNVAYSTVAQSINESSDCGFTDVIVTLKIAKAPSATATATVTTSGTVNSDDYQFLGGNTVTFLAGQTADKTVTIRITNDSFVESDETLILNINLANGGGDAVVTSENTKQQVITIINDDVVPNASLAVDVYDGDFENTTGWASYDADGDGNPWYLQDVGLTGYGDIVGACGLSESNGSVFGTGGAYTPDNYMVSDIFTIPAGATASVSYVVGSYTLSGSFQEHYSVYFTTITTPTAFADLREHTLENDRTVPAEGTEIRNHDLTAYAGQTGQLVFRHHNTVGVDGLLLIDTINVDAVISTSVQTALNSGTPDQDSLSNSGTVYALSTADGNVMAGITNTNGVDYGCVSTSVSRASGTCVAYQVAGAANYVMGKTFAITPASVQIGGNATVKFYFTEAEIVEWETTTGNSRNTLAIIKDNGVSETVTATLGAFGTNVTLEGSFTSGINGTYYFGKMGAVLGVAQNELNIIGLYPNPSNGIFNLSVDTNTDAHVSLFDIRGRKVHSELHSNNSDIFVTKLDFSALASGIYMLQVKSGTKKAIKKIVIQ